MITQLRIEPTIDKLKYSVQAHGLVVGAASIHLLSQLSEKQNIFDLIGHASIAIFTDPLRIIIFYFDDGTVATIDVQTPLGSNLLAGDSIPADLKTMVEDLRAFIESQPLNVKPDETAKLGDVSAKDEP